MKEPIIVLKYNTTFKLYGLILCCAGIGFIGYDYIGYDGTLMERQILGSVFTLIGTWASVYSRTTYTLYKDKIVRKLYGISTILHIDIGTFCFEDKSKTKSTMDSRHGFDSVFYIRTERPKQEFKIYESSWENYTAFKEETEKVIKQIIEKTQWQNKITSKRKVSYEQAFDEKVERARQTIARKGKRLGRKIGVGIGVIIILMGIMQVWQTTITNQNILMTVMSTLFLVTIGILVVIYFSFISE